MALPELNEHICPVRTRPVGLGSPQGFHVLREDFSPDRYRSAARRAKALPQFMKVD